MTISALPSCKAWIRWCALRPEVRINEYLAGYSLLAGPHVTEWLERGFEDMLQTIRNTGAESILREAR
jgi:hypothetical protein